MTKIYPWKYIPRPVKRSVRKVLHFGRKYYCNVCNSNLNKLIPGGLDIEIIKELDIAGAGYHKEDYCPVCKASYRQRLQYLYIQEKLDISTQTKMLHIAPEECYYDIFSKKLGKNYICGDLEPERYAYYANPVKLDLTEIPFPGNNFNIIICNHVLEHIPNDKKAMKELYRVLKKGGSALLQIPLSLRLNKTYEDSSIQSPEEKLKHFGQRDHVRIYAIDFADRLRSTGFQVKTIEVNYFKHNPHFEKLKLDQKEKLFIATKQ